MTVGRSQKSKNTAPEVAVRQALRGVGLYGYRIHQRITLPPFRNKPQHTTPDIVFESQMVAIFVDGDHWHGCIEHYRETRTNTALWRKKVATARARDQRHSRYLSTIGWRVFRVWECQDPQAAARAIKALIETNAHPGVYGLPIPPLTGTDG